MAPFGPWPGKDSIAPTPAPTFYQTVTDFWIDPVAGSDANDGTSVGTPIQTMARWRQLIWGARYGAPGFANIVTIHVLSSSALLDDGIMYGFTTIGTTARVCIVGVPTQIGANSILTGVVAYAGNVAGTVTDAALPASWAASYGLSGVGGTRFIRRVGGAGPAQAVILPNEAVAKTVQIGQPTNTSETSTANPTAVLAPFAVNDVYQVTSRNTWPRIVNLAPACVQVLCLDIVGVPALGCQEVRDIYALCGFLAALSWAGIITTTNCGYMSTVVAAPGNWVPQFCSFINTIQINGAPNWNGQDNVFLGAAANIVTNHNGDLCSSGTLRFFNVAASLLNLTRGARADLNGGAIVGAGNTGKLITVDSGSYVSGGNLATAATTDPLPYQVTGVAAAGPLPIVDNNKGSGIYQ